MLLDLYLEYLPPVVADALARVIHIIALTAPYWFPIVLLFLFVEMWYQYVRANYISKIDWALVEVKLPSEIAKSPAAMELVYTIFHQTSSGTWYDRWWNGKVVAWFSLELDSIEGSVHFIIRTDRKFLKNIESHIYSQFPEVTITEVDDYTKYVPFNPESEWKMFGAEFKLAADDPYPIKTYIDYETDKEVRDDITKVDPITPVIEYLGSIGKDEQIWIQINIRAAQKRFNDKGKLFRKHDWKVEGKNLVAKIRKREARPGDVVVYDTKILSPGEESVVKNIERSLGKLGFDVGIRSMYLGKGDSFDGTRIPGLIMSMKQYNHEESNGFKHTRATDFDYPWQDFKNIRLNRKKRFMFDAYKKRSYFYLPYVRKPMMLSSEELATIFHFPGSVSQTPTFDRVLTKTGQAPGNLPS